MNFYQNKVCVVSGAASGMGRSYAMLLGKYGARLALCDVDLSGLQKVGEEVSAQTGISPLLAAFDVAERAQWDSFAQQVKEQLGDAELVVNNAGIEGSTRPVWCTSMSELERVMEVNFYGMVHGTQSFLPQLLSRPSASLVNVSSIFGIIGTPNNADYCASKFAIRGFTESLMVEMAELRPALSVHLVHPGGIKTAITRKPGSQAFSRQFLTTPADDIAEYVLRQVSKGKKRIVYGNQAWRSYWASRLLPLSWIQAQLKSLMGKLVDPADYQIEKVVADNNEKHRD